MDITENLIRIGKMVVLDYPVLLLMAAAVLKDVVGFFVPINEHLNELKRKRSLLMK